MDNYERMMSFVSVSANLADLDNDGHSEGDRP